MPSGTLKVSIRSAKGELPNLTGVGQEYESPHTAELVVDGTAPLEENIELLVAKFLS